MDPYTDAVKEAKLSSLKEEYNLLMSKKPILKSHQSIIEEYF